MKVRMDGPVDTTTMSPAATLPGAPALRSSRTSRILAGIVLLVLIIGVCVAAYFYFMQHPQVVQGTKIIPSGEQVLVESVAAPFQPVTSVNQNTGAASLVTATGQGNSTILAAAISGTSTPYYLIADPELNTTNLYAGNVKKPSAGLAQLTSSQTFKYDLSYDPVTGSAAYVVAGSSTPQVMVYSQLTKKEVSMGTGTDPMIMPGGFFVVLRQGTSVLSENTITGKTYPLVTIASTSPFAVDPDKGTLAIYNAQTSSIQYFTIKNQISASYMSSTKINHIPAALVYVQDKVLMSYSAMSTAGKNIAPEMSFMFVGSTQNEKITFSSKAPSPVGRYILSAESN